MAARALCVVNEYEFEFEYERERGKGVRHTSRLAARHGSIATLSGTVLLHVIHRPNTKH